MRTSTKTHSDFFYGAFAAIAMIGPMLLVIAAGTMHERPETGEFVVYGHGIVLAVLATALVLRIAYVQRYSKALKIMVPEPNYSITA
jgi:threonine/homoserine/homoserine lactone efflux protein